MIFMNEYESFGFIQMDDEISTSVSQNFPIHCHLHCDFLHQ